jgi:hypothetical protein
VNGCQNALPMNVVCEINQGADGMVFSDERSAWQSRAICCAAARRSANAQASRCPKASYEGLEPWLLVLAKPGFRGVVVSIETGQDQDGWGPVRARAE